MKVKIKISCGTHEELNAVLEGLDAPLKRLHRSAKRQGKPFRAYLEIERRKGNTSACCRPVKAG